ncbi:MAG: 2-oxo acid dehydrogenase subunit E2 [Candidatus Omnitrophota bacterium]|nr:2-oxo acid dehydrogenase subunit E2 [Candidatus Omnitrophota bacterium]
MEIRLPQLGEGADSGTVVSVMVSVGDKVRKDQTLLELENQKAVAPIPAPAAGTVAKIHVKQGDVVSVGQLLMTLQADEAEPHQRLGTSSAARTVPPRSPVGQLAAQRVTSSSGFPPPASPSIRKMARELGVDLSKVPGSGHGGRITPEDVRHYLEALQNGAVQKHASLPVTDFSKWGPIRRKPFTPTRQAIARAMEDSWRNIPHVTLFDEADVSGIQTLIKKHGPAYEKKGLRLTLTGCVIRVLSSLLKKHPVFNSSLDENSKEIVLKDYVHIGVAVDTEAGLLVPVLRDADKKNVSEISRALQDLAEKARSRALAAGDLQGGTFTISNQGGIGGGHFTPIIHRPEVAILGLGRAKLREGKQLLPLAVSFDHRVLDGADAARFMRDLVEALEGFPESEVAG